MITISCKTSRFNTSETKEDFINDCCFGEDFSEWVTQEISKNGAIADVVCMEDFGWFNQVKCDDQTYGLAISGYSENLPNNPNYGSWFLSFDKKRAFVEVLLGKNKDSKEESIFKIVFDLLNKAGFDEVCFENTSQADKLRRYTVSYWGEAA